MWLKRSNGQVFKMVNEQHIKRLKEEGAFEIDDPTAQEPLQDETPQSAEPDGSPEMTTEPLEGTESDAGTGQEQTGQEHAPVDPEKPDSGKSKRKGSGS